MVLQHAQLLGEKIGRFQVLELLGHGAMASVYHALDTEKQEDVALKIPDTRFVEKEDFINRFIREARAMALLQHHGIVGIQGIEQHERIPLLVMEYVEGESLEQILAKKSRLGLDEAVEYMLQICDAVAYAHEQGVIHRDLKPSNLLINETGRLLIADFGISKIISTNAREETLTFVGTPIYMSPEQCGEGVLDSRTDLYSLGVIFYEMLLGKPPFCGGTPAEIIKGHLLETPKFPKEAGSTLHPKIVKIIRKLLAKNPQNRYGGARELAADLISFKEKRHSQFQAPAEPPLILCHLVQRMLAGAVTSTLESIYCSFEMIGRAGDLIERIEEDTVDAVVLGAEPGDTRIFTVAERVRKKSRNRKLQIILINSDISREEVKKAFECGINDIIAEPFNPSILMEKLENILPLRRPTPESRKHFRAPLSGPLTMRVDCELVDISEGGIRIMTNVPLKTGEIITFEIEQLRMLDFVTKSGQVMWISTNESNDSYFYQAGISFINLTERERTRLRKWILEKISKPDSSGNDCGS
jgi:DNA-binding response OmpR family regulator/predicted Ser/Thr protein kinase